jgi:hypothetical protein
MELDPEARAILAPYVHDGRVDYAALAKNRDLDDLIARIGAYDPAADSRDEQLAFYLNAYNLLTINTVLQRLRRNPQWARRGVARREAQVFPAAPTSCGG